MSEIRGAILVLAATPGRAQELTRALESTKPGSAILAVFALDPMEQRTVEDARLALRSGYRLDAATRFDYHAIAVYGDVPLSKRAIDDLRAASNRGAAFYIVGVADGGEQQAALNGAGVVEVARLESLAADFPFVMQRASQAAKAEVLRQNEAATAARPTAQYTVISGQERSGLLPGGGVIMVHANKGGAGKSTIAASIAYGLALGGPAVLVDMNPSGAHVHQSFAKWLAMPENGAFQTDDELLGVHGLSVLSNRINHANVGNSIDPASLRTAMLDLVPHGTLKGRLNLSLIPGIRTQHEYQIGVSRIDTPVRMLLTQGGWAQDLLSLLRAHVKSGYVVLDTGDTEANAPAAVMFTRSDLIVWVVNCMTQRYMRDEFRHLAELVDRFAGQLPAKFLVVANLIADGPSRVETPNAPTAAEAEKLFGSLRKAGTSLEVAPARLDRRALALADDEGLPVLAIAEKYPNLQLVGDLIGIVNRINNSLHATAPAPKSKGGFSLFGKKKG
jgi:hypothetical protein